MSGSLLVVSCALLVAGAAPPAVGDAAPAPELHARHWFNNPAPRLRDDRDVLLLFFSTRESDGAPWIGRLNRIARGGHTVVIALTADSRGDAERFIEKNRVRFTVGAGSRSARDFGITRLPALLKIDRRRDGAVQPLELEALDPGAAAPGRWGPYGNENVEGVTDPRELEELAASDAFWFARRTAVRRLYEVLDAPTFISFAEQRLSEERDPYVRGALEFYRMKAAGAAVPEARPPSVEYERAYDPAAPQWKKAAGYLEGPAPDGARGLAGAPVQRLAEVYWACQSEDPNDVLIRSRIVAQVHQAQDRAAARSFLLRALPGERDPGIRGTIAAALPLICPPGDAEAAAVLENAAAAEADVLRVRPVMEWAARYLRTGQGDTNEIDPDEDR